MSPREAWWESVCERYNNDGGGLASPPIAEARRAASIGAPATNGGEVLVRQYEKTKLQWHVFAFFAHSFWKR